MNRFSTLLLIAAMLTAPLALSAQTSNLPRLKAGLWEITWTFEQPIKIPGMKETMCVDPATDREMMEHYELIPSSACKNVIAKRDGNTLVINADCTQKSTPIKTRTVISGDPRSAYTARMHVTLGTSKGPMLGVTAKWRSADCRDMKPGDISKLGGRIKINVKQLNNIKQQLKGASGLHQ